MYTEGHGKDEKDILRGGCRHPGLRRGPYSWLLIISSSGIPTAISRMVSERLSMGDYAGARRVFRHALALLAIVGLVTTAVLYFGAGFFANSVLGKDDTYIMSFVSLAPALFFVSCMCAYRGYLQGAQHMTGTGLSQLTEQVVKCLVGLMLAARWIGRGPEYGAAGLLLGITVSEFVALLVVMGFRVKNRRLYMPLDASRTPANNRPVVPELLRIAIPITLGASIIPITSMLDVKMIFSCMGRYMSEAAVNQRYVALSTNVRSLINLPASLTTALAMSIVPAIAGARARKDREGMHHFAGLGLKLSMAIGMLRKWNNGLLIISLIMVLLQLMIPCVILLIHMEKTMEKRNKYLIKLKIALAMQSRINILIKIKNQILLIQ